MDAELLFEYSLEDTKLPLITVSHASGVQADAGCLTLMKLWDYVTSSPADVDLPVVSVLCLFRWGCCARCYWDGRYSSRFVENKTGLRNTCCRPL